MASDHDRSALMGGESSSAGRAVNLKAGRQRQIDNEVDKATGSAPAASATPSVQKSGVDFFKSKSASPAEKAAKQKALLAKLRAHDKD